jgi:hypothetical protein
MKLSEFKNALTKVQEIYFSLEDGTPIPAHVHITEVGEITKKFVDCGGKVRTETVVNFQLWYSTDTHHRLTPIKVMDILDKAEQLVNVGDNLIEVEYQQHTIGKFGISFDGREFVLTKTTTTCLADDMCGIPEGKKRLNLTELTVLNSNTCTPESGCC